MRFPRFRFTLGQLIKVIACLAFFFALMRTPAGPLILAIVPVVPGFAIDRARGGLGIVGAMLAGLIESLAFGVVLLVYVYIFEHRRLIAFDSPTPIVILLAFGVAGLGWGTLVGLLAWGVLSLLGRPVRPVPPPTDMIGPIAWRGFGDRGLEHPRAGGRLP
jgi:hypothetical protein